MKKLLLAAIVAVLSSPAYSQQYPNPDNAIGLLDGKLFVDRSEIFEPVGPDSDGCFSLVQSGGGVTYGPFCPGPHTVDTDTFATGVDNGDGTVTVTLADGTAYTFAIGPHTVDTDTFATIDAAGVVTNADGSPGPDLALQSDIVADDDTALQALADANAAAIAALDPSASAPDGDTDPTNELYDDTAVLAATAANAVAIAAIAPEDPANELGGLVIAADGTTSYDPTGNAAQAAVDMATQAELTDWVVDGDGTFSGTDFNGTLVEAVRDVPDLPLFPAATQGPTFTGLIADNATGQHYRSRRGSNFVQNADGRITQWGSMVVNITNPTVLETTTVLLPEVLLNSNYVVTSSIRASNGGHATFIRIGTNKTTTSFDIVVGPNQTQLPVLPATEYQIDFAVHGGWRS